MISYLWKVDKLSLDIFKEVRLEWSKTSRSTKIIDKKSVNQGVRGTFKDTMKIE